MGKVVLMLQEMKDRSIQNKAEADAIHVQVQGNCTNSISETNATLQAFGPTIENGVAGITQMEVDIGNLEETVGQHETDMQRVGQELALAQRDHANATAIAAQDIADYDAAIAAIDRAIQIMQATGPSFLQQRQPRKDASPTAAAGHVKMALNGVSKALQRVKRYTPDTGDGIAKDEHLFDDFDNLTTASSAYVSQTGTIEAILGNLKNAIGAFKQQYMSDNTIARQLDEQAAANLETQIESSKTAMVAAQGQLANKRQELMTAQQDLAEARENQDSTSAYLTTLDQACTQRITAYQEMNTLRENEIAALTRAVEIIAGIAGSSQTQTQALLRVKTQMELPSVPRRNTASMIITQQKVLGFLRVQAQRLGMQSLDQLVGQVAELVTQTPDNSIETVAQSDPMAKVRGMIQDLITRLQAEAAQESSHKAWCDTELAENEHAMESAQADIEKHTARGEQLTGDIQRLGMELQDLNVTLEQAVIDRASLVDQRNVTQTENSQVIADAQVSLQAVEAAIMLLEQYYQNASAALALVQAPRPMPALPVRAATLRLEAALLRRQQPATVTATTTATTLPAVVTGPRVAGPLVSESQGVLAMLAVVRDGYTELISKTQREDASDAAESVRLLQEHDVMVAAAEKDVTYKTEERIAKQEAMNVSTADLNASVQLLSDAQATREQLAPPCLNVETYEEKKAKREAEIAALEEAYQMIEQYEQELGGVAVLLQGKGQEQERKHMALRRQLSALFQLPLSVAKLASNATVASQANATANATGRAAANATANATASAAAHGKQVPLTDVVDLLRGIRTEVAADLAADTQVHGNMMTWCDSTISQKQSAIAEANERDRQLVLLIETSASSKAQLETELSQLEQDLARAQQSLQQSTSMRTNELEKFREQEKELLQSIQALRNALVVLDSHYNHTGTQPAADAAVAQAEADVGTQGTTDTTQGGTTQQALLVAVAGQVKQALESLPHGDTALNAVQTNAIIQDFLNRPEDLTPPKRAALATTGTRARTVNVGQMTVDGHQIVGILSQLLETFEADLVAAQARNTNDNTSFVELQATKEMEVEALQESITSKQSQLANHMVSNSEAKEDLEFVRASRKADTELLHQVQEQCREVSGEFKVRNETRHHELSALDDAITILSAEASSAQTSQTVQFHAAAPAHHVFVRHRRARANATASTTPKPAASSIVDAFIKSHKLSSHAAPRRLVLPRVAQPGPNASKANSRIGLAGAKAATATLFDRSRAVAAKSARPLVSSLPSAPPAGGAPAAAAARHTVKKALMALAEKSSAQRAGQAPGEVNGVLREGLMTVANMIDDLRSDLLAQKQQEINMKDTCISERHQATAQMERRQSDETRYNTTIERKTNEIEQIQTQVAALRQEIEDLNTTLNAAIAARQTEYDEFRTSVQEQEAHQGKLHEAIEALQKHYEPKTSFLQLSATATRRPDGVKPPQAPAAKALAAAAPAGVAKRSLKLAHVVAGRQDPPANSSNVPGQTAEARPDGFSKPLQSHGGGAGVIGILQLLIEESEAMVEQIVQAETSARDAHGLDLEGTKRSIESKDREAIVMTQNMGKLEAEKQQIEELRTAVQTEMGEIASFLAMVAQRCDYLLANFETSQAARDQEIENLVGAKQAILGAGGASLGQVATRLSTGAFALPQH